MRVVRGAVLATLLVAVGFVAAGDATPVADASPPITFNCTWDSNCPEISIAGDPVATLGGSPSPFRGYGDPSLERDPTTGTIWMAYSWLDLLVSDPGPPPVVDLGVSTHLARSDDGGHTFTYVRALNSTDRITHPDTGAPGWAIHEVPTIAREAGGWEALWLTYFDPLGSPPSGPSDMTDFYYTRSTAATAGSLGDSTQAWADGYVTSASFGVAHNLSQIPELSDCAALTEPALLAYDGVNYLATSCIVIVNGVRRSDLERLVLLRENVNGYTYVGKLLDYGGQRLEQADLSIAQNGAVLLITTPVEDTQPNNRGCRVFEVTSLATAQVRRDVSGAATVLMSITGDDNQIGPGLCTYDAGSATGVIMVMQTFNASPLDISYSMRATGLQPEGVDTDGDGLADSVDPCPLVATPWAVPSGDSDCDGYPNTVQAGSYAPESFIGTDSTKRCAATPAMNDEPLPDAWPMDFNDDQKVNTSDVLHYTRVFNTMLGGPPGPGGDSYAVRYDLNGDGFINTSDVLHFVPFFNKSCTP